jgi:hypothetical protein
MTSCGTVPSLLVYVRSIAAGVAAAGPVSVSGNVSEFAPAESPSGEDGGEAGPIEIVHA